MSARFIATRNVVILEAGRHGAQFSRRMDGDIEEVARIIQQSKNPGVQAIAPQVKQVLRETKELWIVKRG